MFVVDHMRPDMITRFDEIYTGGFRWLIDNGVIFTNNFQDYVFNRKHKGAAEGGGRHFSAPRLRRSPVSNSINQDWCSEINVRRFR